MITKLKSSNNINLFNVYDENLKGSILLSHTEDGIITAQGNFKDNTLVFYLNREQNKQNGQKFLESLVNTQIFLNNRYIGQKTFIKGTKTTPQADGIQINGQSNITVYDIGIGNRFLFFYADNRPIACAHHNGIRDYTIFANDEWITEIVSTYIVFTIGFSNSDSFAINYTTPNMRLLEKYDGNFISELIKDEPFEIRQQYQSLIHDKKDSEKVLSKAVKDSKKTLFQALIFTLIIGFIAITAIFGIAHREYKDIMNMEQIYAINNSYNIEDDTVYASFDSRRPIDVTYKLNGKTYTETIYLSKSDYEEVIEKEHFYFRRYSKTDENGYTQTHYCVGEFSPFEFGDFLIISIVVSFFILLDSLLLFALIKLHRQNKKRTQISKRGI